MILLLGGTSDSIILARQIQQCGMELMLSTATFYGESIASQNMEGIIVSGKMNDLQMKDFCIDHKIKSIVDASHPYAKIVTETAIKVSQELSIDYLRYERPNTAFVHDNTYSKIHFFPDFEQACIWMNQREGNILFTTGSKDIPTILQRMPEKSRLYFRILPISEQLEKLENMGLVAKQIIAMQGPFSTELNVAMIRQLHATMLVTKDSGKAGFTDEKMMATSQCHCELVVIQRPKFNYPVVFSEFGSLITHLRSRLS